MLNLYVKLFNHVFDTGIVPNQWLEGHIIPLYKHKGSKYDPDNYRAITIVSCLGKLFTSVITTRLTSYAEQNGLITEAQSGFRKGYSTADNLFSLHAILEILFNKKKKRCFVHLLIFRKSCDTVWRQGLWYKLLLSRINGKCLNIIKSMYKSIKSCIKVGNEYSDYFPCTVGVRQGENMSPLLFAMYLNDLEQFLGARGISDLQSVTSDMFHHLDIYVKLFLLLYADDTILMSESKSGLQDALDYFHQYCIQWKLQVNTSKTKVVIF